MQRNPRLCTGKIHIRPCHLLLPFWHRVVMSMEKPTGMWRSWIRYDAISEVHP